MEYKTIIDLLLEKFPNFKLFMAEEEYLLELPHCVFDMLFVPYVEKLCQEEQVEELNNVGIFFENMETCNDKKVQELLNVSFLEPFTLGDNDKYIIYLKDFLGKETLKDYRYWLKKNKRNTLFSSDY